MLFLRIFAAVIYFSLLNYQIAGSSEHLEENSTKEIIRIQPFYNDFNSVIFSITFENFKDTFEGYNISLYRIGPRGGPLNTSCSLATQHYEIENGNLNVIIPETSMPNTFLLSKCKYKIIIYTNHLDETKNFKIDYTIPVTSVVKNIQANSFFDFEEDTIKLNISWDNPEDYIFPTNYNINAFKFEDDSHHCNDAISQERHISANNTNVIMSNIYPGCTYNIEVVEQPANDLKAPNINFTVPDCVDQKCICHYQRHVYPAPIIEVQQVTSKIIKITWKIPKNNMINLTAIKFRVSLPLRTSSATIKTHNITTEKIEKEYFEDIYVEKMNTGVQYSIQAWYINASYCESSLALMYYNAAQHIPNVSWGYQATLSILLACILASGCALGLRKRRWSWGKCLQSRWINYRLRNNHSNGPTIRRIYRPNGDSCRTTSHLTVPMLDNNLYVHKELVDQRDAHKTDDYEVNYSRLLLGKEIGTGAFGQVFLARATGIVGRLGSITVAVKKLRRGAPNEELDEFLLEIEMLKQIGRHPNIVTLLGCCTLKQPYCMIMEYAPCGDLLHYLRALRFQYEQRGKSFLFMMERNTSENTLPNSTVDKQKISDCSYITPESIPSNRLPSVTETEYTILGSEPRTPGLESGSVPRSPSVLEYVLDPKELQSFAVQIARGMQHLEKKQIVHRDLAARNVLIDENKTLKISDFGLSRSGIYVNSRHKKVPLRWLSVEAIRDNLYTSKSDVWAYGIVLWEIGTLGGFPYPTVADHDILTFLLQGKRLVKPENCTNELYSLMQHCWAHSVDQRPSFTDLLDKLEAISSKRRVYVDFSQLNPSYVFPPTEEQSLTQIKCETDIETIEVVVSDVDR